MLKYYNLIEKQSEIGIDWNTDTYDEGFHLNVYGAEKTSVYFGKILTEECGIEDKRDNSQLKSVWDNNLNKYNERKKQMEAESK